MKRLGNDVGQVSILTVLCLTCLLGFVAFAVDVGILLRAKQVAQTAADSAVMAAVAEFNYGDMTVAARAVATTVPSPNCVYTLGSAGTDIGGNLDRKSVV